jgi:hypothetical protein
MGLFERKEAKVEFVPASIPQTPAQEPGKPQAPMRLLLPDRLPMTVAPFMVQTETSPDPDEGLCILLRAFVAGPFSPQEMQSKLLSMFEANDGIGIGKLEFIEADGQYLLTMTVGFIDRLVAEPTLTSLSQMVVDLALHFRPMFAGGHS